MIPSFILILSLVLTSYAQNIVVQNHPDTQDWYLRFTLENADASSCGDLIDSVYILENGEWRANSQQHTETNGYGVAFNYASTKFSDLLPISVKIEMSSGKEIYLMEIITTISDTSASFTSSESICGESSPGSSPSNTPSPTTPTPTTPAPVQDDQGDDNSGNSGNSDNDNQGSSGDGISGHATYYNGGPPQVACGYFDVPTASFPYGYFTAVGEETYDYGYQCGACYRVTCTGSHEDDSGAGCGCSDTPSVIVQVMDECGGCSDTHFDLSLSARNRISTCDLTNIEFERVDCEYATNIKIWAKEGSSVWWYGLYVYDVAGRGALSSVQLRPSGGDDWIYQCDKTGSASYWQCHRGSETYSLPMDVKFIDDEGNEVIGYGVVEHTQSSEIDTGVQFEWSSSFETSSDQSTKSNNDGTLEVAAGIIGVVVILVILGVFGYIYYRKRSNKKEVTFDHEDGIEMNEEMDTKQENEEQEQEAVSLNSTA